MPTRTDGAGAVRRHAGSRAPATLLVCLLVAASLATGLAGTALGASATAGTAAATSGPASQQYVDGDQHLRQDSNESSVSACGRSVTTMLKTYTGQVESLPKSLTGMVRDTEIHMRVTGDGGGDYTLTTNSDGEVVKHARGKPSDASLLIEMSCETFGNITDSQDPSVAFRKAYKRGEIKIVGLGAVNWAIIEAAKVVSDPVSLVVVLATILLVAGYVVYRRSSLYYRDF